MSGIGVLVIVILIVSLVGLYYLQRLVLAVESIQRQAIDINNKVLFLPQHLVKVEKALAELVKED